MSNTKKLSSQSGLEIGSKLPALTFKNFNGENIALNSYTTPLLFIFVSLHCEHCVDLLPHIDVFKNKCNIILFSNGDAEDHNEMQEYFQWNFPLISLSISEMKKIFEVEFLPFANIYDINHRLISKGVVYNESDLKFLIESKQV
ncbi:redoxin domain-containing protein [Paenibacillus hunanensis]|uniref:redoxin domain-containing protein n=1 Tax=Paenibacillus hunanensis TaxID=539262 RepID=UPI002026F0AC|nr:redoxin domain-containing protein [Paenibacillus hunanensis]MCL9661777.1 redoxin domain-containing protein [Paenibacillus hunanensis]